jgi:SAM-dependent methyltransferase
MCAACGRATVEDLVQQFRYWYCAACNLRELAKEAQGDRAALFAANYFRDGDRSGYYDYVAEARCHRHNANERLDQIAAAGVTAGALLEVGTAAGFLLEQARARGFGVAGVDISTWSRQETAARTGVPVQTTFAEVARPANGFQAVAMIQVLAHMPDAPAALRSVAGLMQPGGVLLLEDWDADSARARRLGRRWQEFAPPSVVWLFGRRALARLLDRAGFTVEAIATPGKRVGFGLLLHKVLGGSRPGRLLFGLARRLGLFRLSLRYRGSDLITVVARRR